MIVSRRHKKTALRTRVIRRIEEAPADEWRKIFPSKLESYDFFAAVDESEFEQFSFYYILVYERKRLVGATTCFMLDYSLDTSINGPLRRLTNSVKKVMPNCFSLRALICGMPLGQGRIGIAGDGGRIIRVILRRMEQIARRERAQVIAFKDFDGSYTGILDPLQKQGFSKLDGLPTAMLNVWFKDFEEYLKTLSGASRYDLRRKFKKVDGHVKMGLEVINDPDDATLAEIFKLYMQMLDKHDMGFEVLPMAFFRNIARRMPDNVRYFLWRVDGKLVAFLLCLVSDELFIDYYVGLDYAVALKYHLYFIKFRESLNWCIKHKIKKYEMGITGYEPKRRLGFDFVPLYLYVKLRNRMFRPIFKIICQFLKFENFDPSLKEIKRSKACSLNP